MSKGDLAPIVGLTGGIGSGKSTVSARLAELGACIVDSDLVAREVVQPGTKGLGMVVERFGRSVLADDGSLDRAKLAAMVFEDPSERKDLNAILHPLIEQVIKEKVLLCIQDGNIPVIVVIPLLFETNAIERYGLSKVIVVDLPEELAVRRVVASRGMSEADVKARIASQAPRELRLAKADFVIDNSHDERALDQQVIKLWAALKQLF